MPKLVSSLEISRTHNVHSCECIRMDPQNHKGYFRRAEALQLMLVSSSSVLGTHMDVVKDYLKCHGLQANVDAFSKAVIMAVKHSKLLVLCAGVIMTYKIGKLI